MICKSVRLCVLCCNGYVCTYVHMYARMYVRTICMFVCMYVCTYVLLCCDQVLDYLAIAVHELSNISERRIERLVNPGEGQVSTPSSTACSEV